MEVIRAIQQGLDLGQDFFLLEGGWFAGQQVFQGMGSVIVKGTA